MAGDEKDTTPLERLFVIARYFLEQGRSLTLEEVVADIPEYQNEARRKFNRDRKVLRAEARIDIAWNEEQQVYTLPRPFFTPTERRALVEAARTVAIDGLDEDVDARAIGNAVDAESAVVAVRVPAILDDLQAHVGARQVVRFAYNGTERTVQPWRIGQWRDDWYLVALEHDATAPKRFALDRIRPADEGAVIAAVGEPGAFTVPDDVDWEQQFSLDPNVWGSDPELAVRIRIADGIRPLFADVFDEWRLVERHDDDIEIEIPARHHESTIVRLLSFGTNVQVIGPQEFTDKLRTWLEPQTGVA